MTDASKEQALQDELDALNASITRQGAHVRTLKKQGGSADEIAQAVQQLQALKLQATEQSELLAPPKETFNRQSFDELMLGKMFIVNAFEIHGGVAGLFDLGPPACAVKVGTFDFPRTIYF